MRRAVLLGLSLLLAGCGDAGSADPQSVVDPSLGILRGVVVDAAIRPLDKANVTLTPGGLQTETGEDGQFRFDGLDPGSYAVRILRPGYVEQSLTVQVAAGEGPVQRIQLELVPSDLRYAQTYKMDGYYECGVWPTNGCANVNIVTGIMLCQLPDPVPCANVTGDRSIFLQWVDPGMGYLQTEIAWEASTALGKSLEFGVGGANRDELQRGIAPSYNVTNGPSPLMVSIDHATLNESRIGHERALLVQVGSGADPLIPGGCVVTDPCGPGVHFQQAYTCFTTTFYGYLPPPGWRFAVDGEVPPPPPE